MSIFTEGQDDEFEQAKKDAEAGNIEAQYRLAIMYERGYDGENKDADALIWWHKAAEQGHAKAQYRLCEIYEARAGYDASEGKKDEWRKWCYAAAEQGHAMAQYTLYAEQSVRGDKVVAHMWLLLAVASWEKHGVSRDDEFWHSNALSRLENASSELTVEQIKEAEKRVQAWQAAHAGEAGTNLEKTPETLQGE